jgi:PAS domain S-box-containing protein
MHKSSIHVLLVEDNPGDARLVRIMLQDASENELSMGSFVLDHADRLQEGLALLHETAFDVILLDLGLPDSQGVETFHRIKAAFPDIPVVIMSGLSDSTVALEAMRQGAQDYLVKGHINEYALSRAIRYAIERSLAQDRLVHLNRVLYAIRNINQLIVHERQYDRLIQQVCDLLVSAQGYNGAWIILVNQMPEHLITAQAGLPNDAFATLVEQFKHGKLPACVQLIQSKDSVASIQSPESSCVECPLAPPNADIATLGVGLFFQEQCYGYIGLSASPQFLFSEEEKQLLLEIANDIGFALHTIDTERQRCEADALQREWAARWKATFDAVSDSICVLDAEWSILQCNQATSKVFGVPLETMTKRKCYEFIHDTDEPIPSCPVKRMKVSRQREIELHQIGERWAQISADPILDADGNITGIVHIIRDITYLKHIQEALQRYSEQLEEKVAERTRELEQTQARLVQQERLATLGHLAAGLAHELRNPLGAIKNAAYLLNMILESPEAEAQTALDVLNLEVDTAKKTINNLLDFSSSNPPAYQFIDVNQTVRQVLEHTPLTPNIDTELVLRDDLPLLLADPRQIDHALDCLLLNAVQAMTPPARDSNTHGQLSIATRATDNEWIEIEVRDTGVGIAPENLERIFEPLFTTKAKGLGLGLAAVRKTVEAHGGHVSVATQVGQGSTFTLHLPLKYSEKEE